MTRTVSSFYSVRIKRGTCPERGTSSSQDSRVPDPPLSTPPRRLSHRMSLVGPSLLQNLSVVSETELTPEGDRQRFPVYNQGRGRVGGVPVKEGLKWSRKVLEEFRTSPVIPSTRPHVNSDFQYQVSPSFSSGTWERGPCVALTTFSNFLLCYY